MIRLLRWHRRCTDLGHASPRTPCLVALAGLLATSAEAGAPTDTLRATFAQANKIISDPATEDRPLERLVAIRALFSKVFDFRGAAEQVLGPEWKVRTPVEQREFTSIFSGFVQRGFVYWLASVAEIDTDGGGITVHYLGEAVDRDLAAVRTILVGRGGRQIRLDHGMVLQGRSLDGARHPHRRHQPADELPRAVRSRDARLLLPRPRGPDPGASGHRAPAPRQRGRPRCWAPS